MKAFDAIRHGYRFREIVTDVVINFLQKCELSFRKYIERQAGKHKLFFNIKVFFSRIVHEHSFGCYDNSHYYVFFIVILII